MHLVDTHCHIDLYPDYQAVIQECEEKGVETVAVTTTPSVFRKCVEITSKSNRVHVALGLHPELAAQRHSEISLLLELMGETRFIGEIGLDFVTTSQADRAKQVQIFETVLKNAAKYGDKILTIHSRRSANEVIAMLGDDFPGQAILHWFSGTHKALEKAIRQGLYFSINPAMLRNESGRKLVSLIPKERVLTETDGPFVLIQDRPARPLDVETVISGLAEIWKMDSSATAAIVYSNYEALVAR